MKIFEIDSKIAWRRSAGIDIANVFYPSFFKDITKRESFFKENFKVEIIDADLEKLKNIFIPLYMEEVANRDDFTLDRENIELQLIDKVSKNNNYKFLFVHNKDEVVTAILFSLKKNGLYLAYKANRKDFDKTLSHKATVSYWTEKLIFEYGKEIGVDFFSYGIDSNPYFGRNRIGLSLYKIKTGMKPKKYNSVAPVVKQRLSEQEIKDRNEPVIFFDNPGEGGLYEDCFLYYPHGSINESYLGEFIKVFKWSGINLQVVVY